MTDQPLAVVNGRAIYDNTPTVVVMIAVVNGKVLVVRRNNEPGRGKLALPGGYQMRGETWRQAGCREVLEETGFEFDPAGSELVAYPGTPFDTDEYGNNLVFAVNQSYMGQPHGMDLNETQEVLLCDADDFGERHEWAFPRHFNEICYHFMSDLSCATEYNEVLTKEK